MNWTVFGAVSVFVLGLLSGNLAAFTARKASGKNKIPYFIIELVTAAALLSLFLNYGVSFKFLFFVFFAFILIIVSAIDYYTRTIPDILPLALTLLAALFCFYNVDIGNHLSQRFINAALGFVIGGGVLIAIGFVGKLIYKKETIGGGDVKLMAAVGAWLGLEKVLLAIFIAALLGSLFGLVLILTKKIDRKSYIPFAPFLAAGSFVTVFAPQITVVACCKYLF